MRRSYPSDISREQFDQILPLLKGARKQTKPREVDLYEVFCGLLYLLRTGCQWRMIPHEFPSWESIYAYYRIWREPGEDGSPSLLEQALKKSGWRGARKARAEPEDELLDY